MQIKDLGGGLGGPVRAGDTLKSRGAAQTTSGDKPAPHSIEDFFQQSGDIGRARALIDALVTLPEIRAEVVERARGLLASGQLDSPERVERAAQNLLEGEVESSG